MAVETAPLRPAFIPSTRFLLAVLVSFGFLVQYAQRIALSIAIVCMVDRTTLNLDSVSRTNLTRSNENNFIVKRTFLSFEERQFLWNEWDQQIILGSYWGGYLLTLVPSGWLSMTMGAKKLFSLALFISSLATLSLSSIYYLERSAFFAIVILRTIIGAAHGALFPVTYTLWSQWAVPNERGALSAIGFCGTNLGTSFIVLIGGLLCRYVNAGWIYIFFISGIIGFIWLPLWLWQVTDSPAEHRSISEEEREYIQQIVGKTQGNKNRRPVSFGSLPWKNIVQSKAVIGLFFTELCSLFGLFFFLSNLGKILTEIHRVPSQFAGYILAGGFQCMLLGTLSSGFTADYLVRKELITLTNVRKLFNSLTSFIPCLCMIALCFCDENHQVLGVASILLLLLSSGFAYGSGYIVNFSDIVPAYSALIFGITTSVSSLNAVIGNIIAGVVIKQPTLQNWRKLFLLFFVIYFIGGVIFLILGSAVPEKWATFKAQEAEEETVPMNEQNQTDEEKATTDHNNSVKA